MMQTVEIYCHQCDTLLYKYHKYGKGHLVKCFEDQIIEDNTDGDLRCPNCGEKFARKRELNGRTIHKIIQGKVFVRK